MPRSLPPHGPEQILSAWEAMLRLDPGNRLVRAAVADITALCGAIVLLAARRTDSPSPPALSGTYTPSRN